MAEEEQTGTVLKAEDGTLYFIRDEVLELCKVAPEEEEITRKMMEDQEQEVSGFSISASAAASMGGVQLAAAVPVRYSTANVKVGMSSPNVKADLGNIKASTIMCCW